jgi:hypothetical protein
MITNHEMFALCVSTANKTLFADAFLGNRTIKIVEALRNAEHCRMIENTFCPYNRKAIQLKAIKNGRDTPATSEFCHRIMADLKAGLRVVVVWGSKNKAKAFANTFLRDSEYSWKLYSSESSPAERAELSNVDEAWRTVQCLNYTSTITVGVNYDPAASAGAGAAAEFLGKPVADPQFDKLYLYGCAAGGLPRDTAQALLRCRVIKSNTLIYTVDPKARFQTALYGRETIREALADKKRAILNQNPVAKWESAPRWAEDNYIENENEDGAKYIAYNSILNCYLEKSGYELKTEVVDEDDSVELKTEAVAFDDIEDVDEGTIERIKRVARAGLASHEEKLILQKHRFRAQLLIKDEAVLSDIWAQYFMSTGAEGYFWNMVGEKHHTTTEYIIYESTHKYIQQSSKKCLKRIALDKVLEILGVKNSSEAFAVENIAPLVEKLAAIEADVYKAYQAHGSRRKGEFTAANAVDLIKMVYAGWSGAKVETERKRTGRGGKVVVYTAAHEKHPLWELLTDKMVDDE